MTLLNSTAPMASLLGGFFVRSFGSVHTILYSGLILSLVSLLILLNRQFRRLPKIEDITSIDSVRNK